MHVCGRSGSKIRPVCSHVFVPFAEVYTVNPIKVLLCGFHIDISVRMNLEMTSKNNEDMAYACACLVFLERPEDVLIISYVACCSGPEN